MLPADVGWRGEALVLGKLSGRAGAARAPQGTWLQTHRQPTVDVFIVFKDLADTKREVTDADLRPLLNEQYRFTDTSRSYKVEAIKVSCGTDTDAEASVVLVKPDGDKDNGGLYRHRTGGCRLHRNRQESLTLTWN